MPGVDDEVEGLRQWRRGEETCPEKRWRIVRRGIRGGIWKKRRDVPYVPAPPITFEASLRSCSGP